MGLVDQFSKARRTEYQNFEFFAGGTFPFGHGRADIEFRISLAVGRGRYTNGRFLTPMDGKQLIGSTGTIVFKISFLCANLRLSPVVVLSRAV